MEDFFANIQSDFGGTPRPSTAATFPCEHCCGTGRWLGGRNQRGETKCFACKGSGHFKTSQVDRRKARTAGKARKAATLATSREIFEEAHPGLITALGVMAAWSEFARSLTYAVDQYGSLTEKQTAAALRMVGKVEASKKARKATANQGAVEVDLSAIFRMFETAFSAGLKRPTYRAEGLTLSRAPDHGRNAGAIYVKATARKLTTGTGTVFGDYLGKVIGGKFHAAGSGPCSANEETAKALQAIAQDPEGSAVRHGRETGSCACCGRELTARESIDRGIGPICATRFGF